MEHSLGPVGRARAVDDERVVRLVHLGDTAVEHRVVDGVTIGEERVPARVPDRGDTAEEREVAPVEALGVGEEVAFEQLCLRQEQ